MTNNTYLSVNISDIAVPEDRARGLDPDWAKALAGMFEDHGHKTAIEVRLADDEKGYVLVAGLHRLEAAKICGWDAINATLIEAQTDNAAAEFKLHEVIENIGRQELTILDRAHHLYAFDRAMKKLHPQLKKGGNSSVAASDEDRSEIFALRSDIAEKAGLSQRSIQMAVKLWNDLSKPTRERVQGTWLADHQAGLMSLAAETPKTQAKILDILFDEGLPPKSVGDALEWIENGKLKDSEQKAIAGALKSFEKMPDPVFHMVMSSQRERVIAWAKEQGIL